MNKTNFNQTGGFALKTERLQELQTAYQIFNAFGALAGDLTIISGCETIGSTVKNGFVYIEGEILEFREASVAVDSTVIIIQESISRAFENGTVKPVHFIRYATFGTSEVSWPWGDFKKPIATKTIPLDLNARLTLIEKKLSIFQSGGVVFAWFKTVAEIPDGFQEVVDMKGRTIFGYDPAQPEFNLVGKAGGLKNKTLAESELPVINPINGTGIKKGGVGGGTTGLTVNDYPSGDYAAGQLIKPFGGGQAFSLLNPYRVAAYIEFIG